MSQLDMAPSSADFDLPNNGLCHAVVVGDSDACSATGEAFANAPDLLLVQGGVWVMAPALDIPWLRARWILVPTLQPFWMLARAILVAMSRVIATFGNAVLAVLAVCAEPKMGGITTKWVVACVHHMNRIAAKSVFRQRNAMMQLISEPMGNVAFSAPTEPAISGASLRASPQPAGVRVAASDARPKVLFSAPVPAAACHV